MENKSEKVNKMLEIRDEAFDKIEGKIYVYNYDSRTLVREISVPSQEEIKTSNSYYFLGKMEMGEGYPRVEITRKGMYLIRPELVSHYPNFADYTLSFRRVYYTK